MSAYNVTEQRRHDLDWIRVLAVIALLFFHTGMLFVAEWGWHIQNEQRSNLFLEWMYFMSGWRMSLLFIVSGAGTYFALGYRSNGVYLRERATRLLIPLIFGMLVIVPPQIYVERLFRNQFQGNYLEFWLQMFTTGPYPQGDISWHHLWFVLYLFLFSVIALPVFRWLCGRGRLWLDRLAKLPPLTLLFGFGGLYAVVYAVLTIPFPGPQNLVDDWGRFGSYGLLFVYGFIWFTHDGIGQRVYEVRHHALRLGLLTLVVLNVIRWNNLEPAWGFNPGTLAMMSLRALSGFCWAVALLGYARQFLNRDSAFLRYANEAVYPFYILHQTAVLLIGYAVIPLGDTILLKFLFVALAALTLSMTVYEVAVRPWALMRRCFGMKPRRVAKTVEMPASTDVTASSRLPMMKTG